MSAEATPKADAIFALARYVTTLKYEQLPAEATALAKMDILDTLGVTLAATGLSPLCEKVIELAEEMGGKEESTIFGHAGKVPAHMAAFANAALAHALNFDDFYDPNSLHIGCMVLPPALAIAERVGRVSGREFIAAYALAVDLECRLVHALTNGQPKHDWLIYGWLLPQIAGYFGAAASAGRLLGLDEAQQVSAFGLAYCQVGGGKQALINPGSDKGVYPGYPAQAGVLSALMAQKGIAGPRESLEGKAGLYKVYFQGEYDAETLTKDLGKKFTGPGFYQYPCCGYTQYPVEQTLKLMKEKNIKAADIEAVTIFGGGKTWALCEPLDVRCNPRVVSEAQYSMPFTIATAIAKGKPRIQHFTAEGIKDPEILSVTSRMTCQRDPECDIRPGSGVCTTKLEFKLKDGRKLRIEEKGLRYGHPHSRMSQADVIEKFRECASVATPRLTKATIEKLVKLVSNLEELENVTEIMKLVANTKK